MKTIPEKYIERWQNILNILAKIADVPAALIMKLEEPYLTVLVSSETEKDNPYEPGDSEHKHGLYCETVINDQKVLDIPNALIDPEWDDNPDIKLGMINYLGIPINWPDGEPFGTICVLDRKERHYTDDEREMLFEYGNVLENYLELIYDKELIKEQKQFINNIAEVIPLCSYCRKIRDNENNDWINIEQFAKKYYDQQTSHGICEDCKTKELKSFRDQTLKKKNI